MRRVGDDEHDPVEEALVSTLARNVSESRKNKGMTQTQLGRKARITQSYVNAIEQGKANVSFTAVIRIAEALEVGLVDLVPRNQYDEASNRSLLKLASALERVSVVLDSSDKSFSELRKELQGIQRVRAEVERVIAEREVKP